MNTDWFHVKLYRICGKSFNSLIKKFGAVRNIWYGY
jgi:hypothetical protein